MKTKLPTFWPVFAALILLLNTCVYAQVGINTTTPNGILDVNSTIYGLVLPRVNLTSTILEAPVTNPKGGPIAIGTTVYNINSTNSGNNDVFPGLYMWEGTKWINQYQKKDYVVKQQDISSEFRSKADGSNQTITGLNNFTFKPKYSGTYKVEVSVNFGTGYIKYPVTGNNKMNAGAQKGKFIFRFNGVNSDIPVYSYGASTNGTRYFLIWQETTFTKYVTLKAGQNYTNTRLQFNHFADTSPTTFENSTTGDGRGYVGYDIPCAIEFTYVGD